MSGGKTMGGGRSLGGGVIAGSSPKGVGRRGSRPPRHTPAIAAKRDDRRGTLPNGGLVVPLTRRRKPSYRRLRPSFPDGYRCANCPSSTACERSRRPPARRASPPPPPSSTSPPPPPPPWSTSP